MGVQSNPINNLTNCQTSINSEEFTKADEMTQEARRNAVKGQSLLFVISPNIDGFNVQKDTVKKIRNLGAKLIAVFNQSDKGKKMHQCMIDAEKQDSMTYLDDYIYANLDDNACENIANALINKDINIDAVFTPYENAIGLVGELNEKLNVYGNSGESYKIARSKNLARDATKAAGLATPSTGIVKTHDVDSFNTLVEKIGYPCIIKPSSGAGSCGVLKATNLTEALSAFEIISNDMDNNTTLSCNLGGIETTVLVEELLVGDEFDIDMLIYDGQLKYCQVVDNWPCLEPYYLETGANMPSLYPINKQNEIKKYALQCIKAMGFHSGAFHVEVMYTKKNGPVLIEVNARQGGGGNQQMNIEMYGVDILENWIISCFGIEINPPRYEQPKCVMTQYCITATKTGKLVDNKYLDMIKNHPNYYNHLEYVTTGDDVTGLDTSFPMWTAEFMLKCENGEDITECNKRVNELLTKAVPNIV